MADFGSMAVLSVEGLRASVAAATGFKVANRKTPVSHALNPQQKIVEVEDAVAQRFGVS